MATGRLQRGTGSLPSRPVCVPGKTQEQGPRRIPHHEGIGATLVQGDIRFFGEVRGQFSPISPRVYRSPPRTQEKEGARGVRLISPNVSSPRMAPRVEKITVDPKTSERMGRIRQHGTSPELAVRKMLNDLDIHYRLNNRDLPGSPDLANRSRRWVVFVHGCFWHNHEGCSRATTPSRNRHFWLEKFEANRIRDRRRQAELRKMGYHVVVVWECELQSPSRVRRKLRRLTVSYSD